MCSNRKFISSWYNRLVNIYFAASIRAGRDDGQIYHEIVEELSKYGEVLTKHVGNAALTPMGEEENSKKSIAARNAKWMQEADVLVSEITQPSLGVGYELANAEVRGIPNLLLYRPTDDKSLSALIEGNEKFNIKNYTEVTEAKDLIKEFFEGLR